MPLIPSFQMTYSCVSTNNINEAGTLGYLHIGVGLLARYAHTQINHSLTPWTEAKHHQAWSMSCKLSSNTFSWAIDHWPPLESRKLPALSPLHKTPCKLRCQNHKKGAAEKQCRMDKKVLLYRWHMYAVLKLSRNTRHQTWPASIKNNNYTNEVQRSSAGGCICEGEYYQSK